MAQIYTDKLGQQVYNDPAKGTISATTGQPVDYSAINNSMLAPVTIPNYQQPNPTPTYPVATLTPPTPQQTLTQPEQQAQDITTRLQELYNQQVGQSSYRAQQENQYNIPGLTQTYNDLSSKLRSIQNEALAIPQQLQIDVTGRGVTSGGLAPIEAGALRKNAIQALGVSSLLYAAQGNLSTALSFVDRAVAQKFDPIREEIMAKTANLDLILKSPAYSLADKNRAQAQKDIQDANARTITRQEDNYKAGQSMAAAAVKLNPGNQAVLLAAQKVLALDPTQPDYLVKVFQIVGQYQSDPVQIQKDIDTHLQAQANLLKTTQDTLKEQLDATNAPLEKKKIQAEIDRYNAEIAKINAERTKIQKETSIIGQSKPVTAVNIGTSPLDVLLQTALTSVRLASTADRAANYYQKLISEGKQSEAEHYVNGIIQNGLTGNDAKEFSLYGSAAEQSTKALEEAQRISSESSGIYKSWEESAKPFVNLFHDQNWIKLQQSIELAQAPFLRSLYGTALTETEQSRARVLAVDVKKDDINTIITKLNGMRQFATENRSRIVAASIGNYDNTSGQTGTLPDGTIVTKNADGSITDAKGNKYDADGNKL